MQIWSSEEFLDGNDGAVNLAAIHVIKSRVGMGGI